MKRIILTFGTVALAASLFGNVYRDSLTNLVHEAVRTNVHLLANQQTSCNTNNWAGKLLQVTLSKDAGEKTSLSNSVARILSAGTAYGTTAVSNASSRTAAGINSFLNGFLSKPAAKK